MKVLLPLDGSDFSKSVVPVAKRLLEAVTAVELHLLTVVDPRAAEGRTQHPVTAPLAVGAFSSSIRLPDPRSAEGHGEALERVHLDAIEWLEGLDKTEFSGSAQVHVEWSAKPVEAIIAMADSIGAELILMPTHGRSGISHLLTGSVTEGVIRSSGRPVLVVGPQRPVVS